MLFILIIKIFSKTFIIIYFIWKFNFLIVLLNFIYLYLFRLFLFSLFGGFLFECEILFFVWVLVEEDTGSVGFLLLLLLGLLLGFGWHDGFFREDGFFLEKHVFVKRASGHHGIGLVFGHAELGGLSLGLRGGFPFSWPEQSIFLLLFLIVKNCAICLLNCRFLGDSNDILDFCGLPETVCPFKRRLGLSFRFFFRFRFWSLDDSGWRFVVFSQLQLQSQLLLERQRLILNWFWGLW